MTIRVGVLTPAEFLATVDVTLREFVAGTLSEDDFCAWLQKLPSHEYMALFWSDIREADDVKISSDPGEPFAHVPNRARDDAPIVGAYVVVAFYSGGTHIKVVRR